MDRRDFLRTATVAAACPLAAIGSGPKTAGIEQPQSARPPTDRPVCQGRPRSPPILYIEVELEPAGPLNYNLAFGGNEFVGNTLDLRRMLEAHGHQEFATGRAVYQAVTEMLQAMGVEAEGDDLEICILSSNAVTIRTAVKVLAGRVTGGRWWSIRSRVYDGIRCRTWVRAIDTGMGTRSRSRPPLEESE